MGSTPIGRSTFGSQPTDGQQCYERCQSGVQFPGEPPSSRCAKDALRFPKPAYVGSSPTGRPTSLVPQRWTLDRASNAIAPGSSPGGTSISRRVCSWTASRLLRGFRGFDSLTLRHLWRVLRWTKTGLEASSTGFDSLTRRHWRAHVGRRPRSKRGQRGSTPRPSAILGRLTLGR